MPNLQPQYTSIVSGGATGPTQICVGNSRRAWLIINCISTAGRLYVSQFADGDITKSLLTITNNQWQGLLRYNLGPMVQSELYIMDFSGNTPNCQLVVSEGLIV
jgi:hypothetical protein